MIDRDLSGKSRRAGIDPGDSEPNVGRENTSRILRRDLVERIEQIQRRFETIDRPLKRAWVVGTVMATPGSLSLRRSEVRSSDWSRHRASKPSQYWIAERGHHSRDVDHQDVAAERSSVVYTIRVAEFRPGLRKRFKNICTWRRCRES